MLFFAFWGLGILLIVLQTTLLQYLPLWLGRPDFIFILAAFIAYRFPWVQGIVLVFIMGWIVDVVAGIHLGFYALICILTFTGLKLLTGNSPVKESTYQIPLLGVFYFLAQLFLYFVYSFILPEELPAWSWMETLQRTVLVVVSAIPFFLIYNSLYEYLRMRQVRSKPLKRRPVSGGRVR